MTLLVTGATGFLGRATVAAARRAGIQVIPVAHRNADGYIRIDLGDPSGLMTLLEDRRPSAIINCAAVAGFRARVLNTLYPVNVLAPAIMASWATTHNALLVQASATIVHGARTERIGPSTPIELDTDYGRSKWLAEEMIGASGCRAAIIRFGGIFGKCGPDHLGLNRALREASEGRSPVLYGNGYARRNYVYVEDAAEALVRCITAPLVGTFWMGGVTTLSIAGMLRAICGVYGLAEGPVVKAGEDIPDQIVETSAELPRGRSFVDALAADRSSHAGQRGKVAGR